MFPFVNIYSTSHPSECTRILPLTHKHALKRFVFHLERLLDTPHTLLQPLYLCTRISGKLNYQVLFPISILLVSNFIVARSNPDIPTSLHVYF